MTVRPTAVRSAAEREQRRVGEGGRAAHDDVRDQVEPEQRQRPADPAGASLTTAGDPRGGERRRGDEACAGEVDELSPACRHRVSPQ